MRRARWKRKNVRDELTHLCQLTHTKERPPRTSDQTCNSPTGCAILKFQFSASPHLKVRYAPGLQNRIGVFLLPCVPLRYALPGPTPGGVSKGEGPQSRPFVPRGGMGDGWRPPCFWWGSKGEESLHQRYLPLALTWECPPCGSKENVGCIPHGKAVLPVPEAGTALCTMMVRSKQPSCEIPQSMV